MPLRESLAAVLRLVRASRGLSKDDFQGLIDPKHVYNLETAKSGVTLDTLEAIASVLQVDALTLLTVAASLERGQSHKDLLAHLKDDGQQLAELGVLAKWHGEFEDGSLVATKPGRRTPPETVEAILACQAQMMSQKETAEATGVSAATVSRIWNRTTCE
ncbi:XRE family transcriptional regulator [Pseudomonas sp. SWRI100]|uniref:helix-turn-helix transcriptional regulator n=1 Tax=Pseudomonas TaxID=286 RepID=UPI0016445106|nr:MULTISPECIES: helix-turn-helix transcriptional regulator [Pseudomonas]MBC3495711.1 helix-turn-helix transcriptional regulator [Pseudomonas sp. SWRI67]MBV4526819.1 XRE family transcriptional regulator [Pseudomonas kermanshahensis]